MPGNEVKNWDQYEALRAKGYSKESSARITNAASSTKNKSTKTAKRHVKKGKTHS